MLYRALRPLLFTLEAERAHRAAISALPTMAALSPKPFTSTRLQTSVAGLAFPNPVGMAPGFDKDAQVPDALLRIGFGFAEVGTVTPLPQEGNPRPRLFRLVEDRAVINRMGFNNRGLDATRQRLLARQGRGGIVGANIGANKDAADRVADYATMAEGLASLADYLTINISSPNTPGLRALQDEGALAELLDAVIAGRGVARTPLFLKLAPDLQPADIDAIARIALDRRLDALIISNTTIERPALASRFAQEAGGLSGAPLKPMAHQRLIDFRNATGGAIPLIGVGGIAGAEDAYARIRAGANLVQLYSAMVYQGPLIGRTIAVGLDRLLARDGYASVAEAVGTA